MKLFFVPFVVEFGKGWRQIFALLDTKLFSSNGLEELFGVGRESVRREEDLLGFDDRGDQEFYHRFVILDPDLTLEDLEEESKNRTELKSSGHAELLIKYWRHELKLIKHRERLNKSTKILGLSFDGIFREIREGKSEFQLPNSWKVTPSAKEEGSRSDLDKNVSFFWKYSYTTLDLSDIFSYSMNIHHSFSSIHSDDGGSEKEKKEHSLTGKVGVSDDGRLCLIGQYKSREYYSDMLKHELVIPFPVVE